MKQVNVSGCVASVWRASASLHHPRRSHGFGFLLRKSQARLGLGACNWVEQRRTHHPWATSEWSLSRSSWILPREKPSLLSSKLFVCTRTTGGRTIQSHWGTTGSCSRGWSLPVIYGDRQTVHPITCHVFGKKALCPFPNCFQGRLPRWLCVTNHLDSLVSSNECLIILVLCTG